MTPICLDCGTIPIADWDIQALRRRLTEAEGLLASVVKNVPIIEPVWRQTYLYDRCRAFVGEPNTTLSNSGTGEPTK